MSAIRSIASFRRTTLSGTSHWIDSQLRDAGGQADENAHTLRVADHRSFFSRIALATAPMNFVASRTTATSLRVLVRYCACVAWGMTDWQIVREPGRIELIGELRIADASSIWRSLQMHATVQRGYELTDARRVLARGVITVDRDASDATLDAVVVASVAAMTATTSELSDRVLAASPSAAAIP